MSWDGRTLGEPKPILTGIPKAGRTTEAGSSSAPTATSTSAPATPVTPTTPRTRPPSAGRSCGSPPTASRRRATPSPTRFTAMDIATSKGLAFDEQGRLWASEFGEPDLGRAQPDHQGRQLRLAGGRGLRPGAGHDQSEGGLVDHRGITGRPGLLAGLTLDGRRCAATGSGRSRSTARTPETRSPTSPSEFGRIRSVIVSATASPLLTNSNTDGRGDPADDDDRLLESPIARSGRRRVLVPWSGWCSPVRA